MSKDFRGASTGNSIVAGMCAIIFTQLETRNVFMSLDSQPSQSEILSCAMSQIAY